MQISASASTFQTLQTVPSLAQDQRQQAGTQDKNTFPDWLTPSSAVSLATDWLSKIAASDVAQVGDLMINGRDDAVFAPRLESKA
jgi:hypothetical protein